MIRHALRLVWKRKRSNALILMEIFFCFLVVFVLATFTMFGWTIYQLPLGFDYENVWSAEVAFPAERDYNAPLLAEQKKKLEHLVREAESFDFVEHAALARFRPFELSSHISSYEHDFREVEGVAVHQAGPGFGDVLRMETVQGRWFRPEDEALAWNPVVIDQQLATALFGTEDPLGRTIRGSVPDLGQEERRVIGVVRVYRAGGELSVPRPVAIEMFEHKESPTFARILVRVRPGTPSSSEEILADHLQEVAREASIAVSPLAPAHDALLRYWVNAAVLAAMIAGFLLTMVALGLVGVLWQNLIRRTREMGLRRAAGASRANLRGQLLVEQLILTTLGISLAALLAVQLPLTGVIPHVPREVYAGGLALAAGLMYLLTTLCALYPSWMAGRMPPAEALRYE